MINRLLVFFLFFACFAAYLFGQEVQNPPLDPPDTTAIEQTDNVPSVKRATLMEIQLPITWASVQPIHRALQIANEELRQNLETEKAANPDAKPPILILSFKVPPNQDEVGRGSQFGACYGLANMLASEEFHGIQTVAYFPQSVQGHAILVALACSEFLVGDQVEFGNACVDETRITPAIKQAYLDIGKKFPALVVEKMLDPNYELWQAETDSGIVWTDRAGVQKLRTDGKLLKDPDEPFIPAGQPGIYTAQQGRQQLGIVDFILNSADGEIALTKALDIKPEQIAFAKLYTNTGRTVRVDIAGPITTAKISEVIRQIRKATEENSSVISAVVGQSDAKPLADFICLWIDSSGGSLSDSLMLAAYLANDLDPMKVRTVAYIPHEARSDAAIIAAACQEVVVGPGAIFGGSGSANYSESEILAATETISKSITHKTLQHWSLVAAMIDPNLKVYKMNRKSNPAIIEYFCEEELNAQTDADDWVKGNEVSKPGTPFVAVGKEAVNYFLADKVAADFKEFKLFYHLENDPTLLEPGWADQLVRALGHPFLSIIVLMLGFMALWGELKTPGVGAGAFIAICCFALFFWSRFLGGTAGWLEVVLFLSGVVFVLMEIFVIPGFGIFGIGGGLAILSSLVLASQTFIIPRNAYQMEQFSNSLLVLVVSILGMTAIAVVVARWMHTLNLPGDSSFIKESEKMVDYAHLLGMDGIASTPLVPAGKATFGNDTVSVVSDCELIEAGTPITVVDVRGYRVVVNKKV